MIQGSVHEAHRLYRLSRPTLAVPPDDLTDWSRNTGWCHLIRRGKGWRQASVTDFGLYLGQDEAGLFVVGVKDAELDRPTQDERVFLGCEKFSSLQELQEHWEID